jgi:NAD(P)-dependent dehydrogenase (short-subunit alcohol dehydrogenase family)
MIGYNPFSLKGKTILITGASSGIGKTTAIECSKLGAVLIITGRNEVRLRETFTELEGSDHVMHIADLLNRNELNNLIENISSLDGIVHSAGVTGHYMFNYLKEDLLDSVMNINFKIPTLLSHKLLKNKKIKKGSSIVFLNSTVGILSSFIGGSVYAASKGAQNGLLMSLALEYAPQKIRINGVMPAMIETPIMNESNITEEQLILDKAKYPLKRYGTTREVAFAIIYLLSDASSWTTGTNLLIDGGKSITF